MFYTKTSFALTGLLSALTVSNSANADIKLASVDDVSFSAGARLQYFVMDNDSDLVENDGIDHKIRRGRLRFSAEKKDKVQLFFQTEFNDDTAGTGGDLRLIDAWIKWSPNQWAQIYNGVHMVASSRQNITGAFDLLALDRPGLASYALSWGVKGRTGLQTLNVPGSSPASGVSPNSVRDKGTTLFGSGKLSDGVHLKYYVGTYEGSPLSDDTERFAGRLQVNLGDDEKGFFNKASYLGKKSTLGLGLSLDSQSKFIKDASGEYADYGLVSADVFWEKAMDGRAVTLELGYTSLNIDTHIEGATLGSGTTPANQASGSGLYFQGGYYVNKWQPVFMYEKWDADAVSGAGSYSNKRLGVNYYINPNSSIKFAIENTAFEQSGLDNATTSVLGLQVSF